MTFQIHYFYITGNDFTFAAIVIFIFLHVPRALHIRNSSPSRSEEKKLASSSTYFPTIFQHRIHPPENGIWLYKV